MATSHPLSTTVGESVLRAGGNAYDAALAVSAALPVVQPHMNGLGGDFFAIVRDGRSRAVNASGPAGREVTRERFASIGRDSVPTRGPLAAITVPGLVAAWSYLGERARLPWHRLLAPATDLARVGFRASPSLAKASSAIRWGDPDFRAQYSSVRAGAIFRQPGIARTLRSIARDRGHGFYHGALARTICGDLVRKGGWLTFPDFDDYRIEVGPPLGVRYRAYRIETNPPPSQGATALVWLNLLRRRDLASLGEARYVSELVRTMYPAYDYRRRYIGDPAWTEFPRRFLTDPARLRPSPGRLPAHPGRSDTTAFSVYDGDIGISAIQSNYQGFGSGVLIRGTGITLSDRGAYFTLDAHPTNTLAPGKRTFHTLMATLATGPRTVLLGSMGGDLQPQVNVQLLTRHLDRGMPMQRSIEAPRFAYDATIYGTAPLRRERSLPLPRAGVSRANPGSFGQAQGISVDGDRSEVGIDPRGDGLLPLPSYGRTR